MRRIMVMGVSSGVGKSTFAAKLGKYLNIPVHHLDSLFWRPNWVEAPLEEFQQSQEEIVGKEQWIIEGNYSNTYDLRIRHADTVIYLELPLKTCLYRVFKRFLLNIGKTRPDMGEGCPEKIDYAFIKFICTTYKSRKKKMAARLDAFQKSGPEKKIIVLKSKREIAHYLQTLEGLDS